MEDIKEVVDHGIADLFEYGQEVLVGTNKLASTNSTIDEKTYTFAEKIKKEMERGSTEEEPEFDINEEIDKMDFSFLDE